MVLNKDDENIRNQDWKLFIEILPGWQERHMAKLLKEYSLLINDDSLLPS